MKNSKIMKKITLGSATVLSAFTLATAVAPTFVTTVHADDVVQQQDQPVLDKIVDTPAFKVEATNCYDSTKVSPDQIKGYLGDPGFIKQNTYEDYTAPEGYEEDPTVKGGYINHDDGNFYPASIAIRFYRPIKTSVPNQGQDTPSAPDTSVPNQGQDTPSAPDTSVPNQGQDTPSAPADTPTPNVEKTAEETPTVYTSQKNAVADTKAEESNSTKEGSLPKAGDASLLSMLLGSTLLGGASLKRFGKKNK